MFSFCEANKQIAFVVTECCLINYFYLLAWFYFSSFLNYWSFFLQFFKLLIMLMMARIIRDGLNWSELF